MKTLTQALFVFAVFLLVAVPQTWGQSTTGTIFGSVLDSTGASIPGASVTLKETRTGLTQHAVSDAKGDYTYAIVNPGDYTVTASIAGFKTTSQTGIVPCGKSEHPRAFRSRHRKLPTESVSVEAGVTLVDTREAQLGETIDQNKVENLPTLKPGYIFAGDDDARRHELHGR